MHQVLRTILIILNCCILPIVTFAYPTISFPPLRQSDNPVEIADALLQDKVIIQGVHGKITYKNNHIDWSAKGPNRDREWALFLNRHNYLTELIHAYHITKNEKYLQSIEYHLLDWITQNPYRKWSTHLSVSWRTLEASRRILGVWGHIYFDLPISENLKSKMLQSIRDHGDCLMNHHAFGGNHLITEMLGLFLVSENWSELQESKQWKKYALERGIEEIIKQSYPDGFYKELSNHYQRVILLSAQQFLTAIHESQSHSHIIQEAEEAISRMWNTFYLLAKPDGFGPLNNDSDREFNREIFQQAAIDQTLLSRLDYNPTLQWSKGQIACLFPYAQQFLIRDYKKKNPVWLLFDTGPSGTDHQHPDYLHLSLSIGNNNFLVDNGRYAYKTDPIRNYIASPEGHNISTINGIAPTPQPLEFHQPTNSKINETDDYVAYTAEATFRVNGSLQNKNIGKQKRTIFYYPNNRIEVIDQFKLTQPSHIQSFWHFGPKTTATIEDNNHIKILEKNQTLHLIVTSSSQTRTELKPAYHSPQYGQYQYTQKAVVNSYTTGLTHETRTQFYWE